MINIPIGVLVLFMLFMFLLAGMAYEAYKILASHAFTYSQESQKTANTLLKLKGLETTRHICLFNSF